VKDHISELVGIFGSLLCLIVFGPDHFIIPSMIVIFAALTLLRPVLDPEFKKDQRDQQIQKEQEGNA
jgi:predicted branched-subunit amino acid permease